MSRDNFTFPVTITTETGSTYNISSTGICLKKNKDGNPIDAFKIFCMKPVPENVKFVSEIFELDDGNPVIGQRLYLSGLNQWWISTPVVSVDYDNVVVDD